MDWAQHVPLVALISAAVAAGGLYVRVGRIGNDVRELMTKLDGMAASQVEIARRVDRLEIRVDALDRRRKRTS